MKVDEEDDATKVQSTGASGYVKYAMGAAVVGLVGAAAYLFMKRRG